MNAETQTESNDANAGTQTDTKAKDEINKDEINVNVNINNKDDKKTSLIKREEEKLIDCPDPKKKGKRNKRFELYIKNSRVYLETDTWYS